MGVGDTGSDLALLCLGKAEDVKVYLDHTGAKSEQPTG